MATNRTNGRASWAPSTPATRGTVVLLPGRGEDAALYERFGTRIAFDGYLVRTLAGRSTDEPDVDLLELIDGSPAPVVLIGSDAGALEALVLAARHPDLVAGAVLVGTPTGPAAGPTVWDDELDARTACPVHLRRLVEGAERGALTALPRDLVLAAAEARPNVPVLVVHGAADSIAPVTDALALMQRLPNAEALVVRGGRHDALNDVEHRSVAAAIVQFLERLRSSADASAVLVAAGDLTPAGA